MSQGQRPNNGLLRCRSRRRAETFTRRMPDAVMERTRAVSYHSTQCQHWTTAAVEVKAPNWWIRCGRLRDKARVSFGDRWNTSQTAITSSCEQAASSRSMHPSRPDSDPLLVMLEITGEEGVGGGAKRTAVD